MGEIKRTNTEDKMDELKGTSLDLTQYNVDKIKEIFPEVFCEDKIDFDKLRLVLGDNVEDREERYEFNWHGKRDAIRIAQTPSTGTLRPDKESSKNWERTENLYIEGDNLEVLKLLQKSYFGKIKMIYIDPPYNTGNDFVYKDDFKDNIENYKEITEQTTKANPETNGRYHTDWLNMIYPRLKLARNLLSEDGVIFISLDDKEIDNLKKICNEIFGESNFVECLVWKKRATPPNDKNIGRIHEFILCYAKDINHIELGLLPRDEKSISRYSNPDNDTRGPWVASDLSANGKGGRIAKSCIYPIVNPDNNKEYFPSEGRCWLFNKEKMDLWIKEGRVSFRENTGAPFLKRYLSEVRQGLTLPTIMTEFGYSQTSSIEADKIFNKKGIFEYAKPTTLINPLIRVGTPKKNDIVLDFFSGSSTTAHAIMQLNIQDGGNRKFIMVQLPEVVQEKSEAYKAGYKNICEIGKERIRRAANIIIEENLGKEDIQNLDTGFKVFKLDSSNLKSWDASIDNLEQQLNERVSNLKENRTNEDLLYEVLLKSGINLTSKIEEIKIGYKTIYNIGEGSLLVCLDDEITQDIVDEIPKHKALFTDTKVIFKEEGFMSDAAKINAVQNLKQFGIKDVRSV